MENKSLVSVPETCFSGLLVFGTEMGLLKINVVTRQQTSSETSSVLWSVIANEEQEMLNNTLTLIRTSV